jgi:cytochrome oxidase assembly protein ShyY1
MLRLLFTPRWLARSLLGVVLLAACVALGVWQWDRAQATLDAEYAALEVPVSVGDLAPAGADLPGENVGRPVFATGRYAEPPLYVSNRSLDGRKGFWVLSPLDLADGSQVAVLRGWLPEIANVPIGDVTVNGVMQPYENFYADSTAKNGVIVSMSRDEIVAAWGADVRAGIVNLNSQEPALAGDPIPVPSTVQLGGVGFPLQNFFYALQWLIFAGFVVFFWWRWIGMDLRELKQRKEAP